MSYDTITFPVLAAGCASYGAGVAFNLICHVWGKMKYRYNKKKGITNEEAVERSNLLTGIRMLKYLAPLLLLILQIKEIGYYNRTDDGITTPAWFWVTLTLTLPLLAYDMFYESWAHTYNCIVGAVLLAVTSLLVTLSLLDSRVLLTFGLIAIGPFLLFGWTVVSTFRCLKKRVSEATITKAQSARAKVLIAFTGAFVAFYVVPYVVGPGVTRKLESNDAFIFYMCVDLATKMGYDLLAWFMLDLPSFKSTYSTSMKLN